MNDVAALRHWLLRSSLPLWMDRGVDRSAAAFHEHLTPDGHCCEAGFRRLRVAARQTYVFAEAHGAGIAGADAAAALGVAFLGRNAALPGGGYAARFDLAGRVIDPTIDLYDQAFVLLAFASAASVLPPAPLRAAALDLMRFIDRAFRHPAGGFAESLPPALPRRQNPHMHLLEAVLAAHHRFGDPIFLATARDLVDLFLARLRHPASGAVQEFFGDDWAAADSVAEPGHCCEWSWLLRLYAAAAGDAPPLDAAAEALMLFVDRHGVHPRTGDLIDRVRVDGDAPLLSARLWPQTERLKAAALRHGATSVPVADAAARLGTWLKPDGLWCELRDAEGQDIPGAVPASSLYHLTCAILTVGAPG